MTATFTIEGAYYKNRHVMPGNNDYIAANRKNPHIGAAMKKEYHDIACTLILSQLRGYKAQGKVYIGFEFYEANKGNRRDPDNVAAFSIKVLLDALKECEVIKDDSGKYIQGFKCDFYETGGEPKIVVTIQEVGE
jgi:Holliday junction resolvase RusA-like endonuclease